MVYHICDTPATAEKGRFQKENGLVYEPVENNRNGSQIRVYRIFYDTENGLHQDYRAVAYFQGESGSPRRIETVVNGDGLSKARARLVDEMARVTGTLVPRSLYDHHQKRADHKKRKNQSRKHHQPQTLSSLRRSSLYY